MTDGLAGDHSEGAAAGRAETDRRWLEDFLDRVFETWDPKRLTDLEQLVDRDEQQNADDGLFSPDGRRALRAAIAKRRTGDVWVPTKETSEFGEL